MYTIIATYREKLNPYMSPITIVNIEPKTEARESIPYIQDINLSEWDFTSFKPIGKGIPITKANGKIRAIVMRERIKILN